MLAASVPFSVDAAVPPIPPGAEKLVQILFKRPEVESCELSPSGRFLAFLREEGGRKILATIDLDTTLTRWRARGPGCGRFTARARTLIYKVSRDKNYYSGLWLTDARLREAKDRVRRAHP